MSPSINIFFKRKLYFFSGVKKPLHIICTKNQFPYFLQVIIWFQHKVLKVYLEKLIKKVILYSFKWIIRTLEATLTHFSPAMSFV